MIVCSCNVISDHDVRTAVSESSDALHHAKQVYGCLGYSAECGRCAQTIQSIIDRALGPCECLGRPLPCRAAITLEGECQS